MSRMFFLLLLLPACSVLTSDEPPVADSTLVDVLIELHLAEARVQLGYGPPLSVRDSIFARYGFDETTFQEALTYYLDHPDAYAELHDAMLAQINDEQFAFKDTTASDEHREEAGATARVDGE